MKPFLLIVVLFLCLVCVFMHVLHRVSVGSESLLISERSAVVLFSHIMSSMRADSVRTYADSWCAAGHVNAGYASGRLNSSYVLGPGAAVRCTCL